MAHSNSHASPCVHAVSIVMVDDLVQYSWEYESRLLSLCEPIRRSQENFALAALARKETYCVQHDADEVELSAYAHDGVICDGGELSASVADRSHDAANTASVAQN